MITLNSADSFARQLLEAQRAGKFSFIDQDTKTVVTLDELTGMPTPYSIFMRALRLQQQAQERRWYRRLAKWWRAVTGAKIPAPKAPIIMPTASSQKIRPRNNTLSGDGEDD